MTLKRHRIADPITYLSNNVSILTFTINILRIRNVENQRNEQIITSEIGL